MTPVKRDANLIQSSMNHGQVMTDLDRLASPGQAEIQHPHSANPHPPSPSSKAASRHSERPYSRIDAAIPTHNATPPSTFSTKLSLFKLQRVKTRCKNFIGIFFGVWKRKVRRTKKQGSTAILNQTIDTLPTDCHNPQNNTWKQCIRIAYTLSAGTSDITRYAICSFDSSCGLDLMSAAYAANVLNLSFDDNTPQLIGIGITGEPVYSLGRLKARWYPEDDTPSTSTAGAEFSYPPKFYDADFYIVDSKIFEVIIGHSSLERNGIYGRKNNMIAPFRSLVQDTRPSAAADAAQDQAHAEAVAAERARVKQFEAQQNKDTDK
ncbi:hypothetical protein FB567DRAFT_207671 [Paraphoma chrysanthemicola]|uniref:Uncharacterized protein n=1 Tax=Paraphoma chrysanthemicola TaxID=798071 RepID=A0A8K0VSD5_9PLEO|nr:hypothetical protein FB567DRAFT_207671 [Paraphoma chrysanthemicola]